MIHLKGTRSGKQVYHKFLVTQQGEFVICAPIIILRPGSCTGDADRLDFWKNASDRRNRAIFETLLASRFESPLTMGLLNRPGETELLEAGSISWRIEDEIAT